MAESLAAERVAQWLDGSTPSDDQSPPEIWACVEIFGHRKHYGRTKEIERFGIKMLRVDVPCGPPAAPLLGESDVFDTFLYAGSAIFSFTPMTEAAARKWADNDCPKPWKPLDRLPAPDNEYEEEE